VVELNSYHEVI